MLCYELGKMLSMLTPASVCNHSCALLALHPWRCLKMASGAGVAAKRSAYAPGVGATAGHAHPQQRASGADAGASALQACALRASPGIMRALPQASCRPHTASTGLRCCSALRRACSHEKQHAQAPYSVDMAALLQRLCLLLQVLGITLALPEA